MLDRLRFIGPAIFAVSLVFGFIFYVGYRIYGGDRLGGARGIMRMLAEALNSLSDSFGPALTGYAIMALALAGGISTAVWLWRSL